MKTALITGITGQDGAYLAKLLLDKGYRVTGVTRSGDNANLMKLRYLKIATRVEMRTCDLLDMEQVKAALDGLKPDEIYNLSGQSSVAGSFIYPSETVRYNILSVMNLLEVVRLFHPDAKFYQATSCEIYGSENLLPITEDSPLNPSSPYGVSKAAAQLLVREYRQAYGLFAVSGILFNHESHLRDEHYFVRKLIRTAISISEGSADMVHLGQAENKRDFGFSPEYVKAMWLMVNQPQPKDYIICSGASISIRNIAEYVLKKFYIPFDRIVTDPQLFRVQNVNELYGDNSSARKELGWEYSLDFYTVLDILIWEELAELHKQAQYPDLRSNYGA